MHVFPCKHIKARMLADVPCGQALQRHAQRVGHKQGLQGTPSAVALCNFLGGAGRVRRLKRDSFRLMCVCVYWWNPRAMSENCAHDNGKLRRKQDRPNLTRVAGRVGWCIHAVYAFVCITSHANICLVEGATVLVTIKSGKRHTLYLKCTFI